MRMKRETVEWKLASVKEEQDEKRKTKWKKTKGTLELLPVCSDGEW